MNADKRRSGGVALSIAILLLNALAVVAQTSVTKTTTPAPAGGFGVIKGRVVNESGQPLANATVMIARFDAMRAEQSVATDREGKFEFTGLEPVPYRMSARLAAYTPLPQDLDTDDLKYRAGNTVTLRLIKGGVLTGTVTNQAGEPIVGITVRARMVGGSERASWPYQFLLNDRITDDRGVYRIYGLAPGNYLVWAGGTGEQTWRVDPFDTDAPTYAPASTRDDAQEFSVRAGEETSGVDIRYRNEPGRRISGKAIAPNTTEIRGFVIKLTSANESAGLGRIIGQPPGNRGFVFRGISDGEYDLSALSTNANGGDVMWSESKRIKVNGNDVTGIELVTNPLSAVSGKLVLQEAKAVECIDKQRPIFSETLVYARTKTLTRDIEVPFGRSGSPENAGADGDVTLKSLRPGQYYFDAQFSGKSWYLDSITLPAAGAKATSPAKPVDAAKNWTTLKSGDRLTGLTITLAQGAASVRGEVTAKEGEKVAVYLVPAEKERADDVLRFFTTVVSTDGKVELNNVAPGRYLVLITSEAVSLNKLRLPDATALRARLRREAEAKNSELELKPCQNVTNFQPQPGQMPQM